MDSNAVSNQDDEVIFSGALYRRSKITAAGMITLYRYWKGFYVELCKNGTLKMWYMTKSQVEEAASKGSSLKFVIKKGPSKTVKLMSWRELDYREEMKVKKPYCLVMLDSAKKQSIIRCVSDPMFKNTKLALQEVCAGDHSEPPAIQALRRAWYWADADGSGTLCLPEITHMLHEKNIYLSREQLEVAFKLYDKDHSDSLDFEEFRCMYSDMALTDGVKNIFAELAFKKGDNLTSNNLCSFFQDMQKESVTINDVNALVMSMLHLDTEDDISVDPFVFSLLLCSADNSLMDPAKSQLNEENMHMPITDYWISSSHNTYLTGDQLTSNSDAHMYRLAFQYGCRCVELDCWDGSRGKPVIYHGHTLTSKIDFREVIEMVRDAGFEKSCYPIILSLENHCCVAQQDVMADMLMEILGDLIVPPHKWTGADGERAPSPWSLRNKVIIKGKTLPKDGEEEDEEEEDEEDQVDSAKNIETLDSAKKPVILKLLSSKNKKKKPKPKVSQRLSDLTWMGSGNKKKHIDSWKEGNPVPKGCVPSGVISLTEGKLESITSAKKAGSMAVASTIMKAHRFSFTRTYPAGHRVDSSNYMPMAAWALGSQIVALNFQTIDTPLRLNQALFNNNQDNGVRTGYVLKPESRRGLNPVLPKKSIKLNITVIQGHHLPRADRSNQGNIISPYVCVTLHGTGLNDSQTQTHTTPAISANGFNPHFGSTKVMYSVDPDVEILSFEVWDDDNKQTFVGYFACRICDIREGIRFCPLHGKGGAPMAQAGQDHGDCPGLLVKLQMSEVSEKEVEVANREASKPTLFSNSMAYR